MFFPLLTCTTISKLIPVAACQFSNSHDPMKIRSWYLEIDSIKVYHLSSSEIEEMHITSWLNVTILWFYLLDRWWTPLVSQGKRWWQFAVVKIVSLTMCRPITLPTRKHVMWKILCKTAAVSTRWHRLPVTSRKCSTSDSGYWIGLRSRSSCRSLS